MYLGSAGQKAAIKSMHDHVTNNGPDISLKQLRKSRTPPPQYHGCGWYSMMSLLQKWHEQKRVRWGFNIQFFRWKFKKKFFRWIFFFEIADESIRGILIVLLCLVSRIVSMTISASARPEYFLIILSMDYLLYYCNNVYLQILGLATIRWAIWKVRIGATFERKKYSFVCKS
jgi:hypothetical protein